MSTPALSPMQKITRSLSAALTALLCLPIYFYRCLSQIHISEPTRLLSL